MKRIFLIFLTILFLLLPKPVQAAHNPLEFSNNKFGIHVADVGNLDKVAQLINSSGGDWGYVTLVIPQNDRDLQKWQEVFNQMRRLHLIPIVRIATKLEGNYWTKPQLDQANDWASFLNSLNWPVKNRYVVLFNEPNHAKEWGNQINPQEYANMVVAYSETFKKTNDDFFILPAGLDLAAASNGDSMDAKIFLDQVFQTQPRFHDYIEGWTSHSYPNPAFSGHPNDVGRRSLKGYQWEINYLHSRGVVKNLPIFITETGWVHNQGQSTQATLSPQQVGQYLSLAAQNAWSDPSIVAITPFVFDYQGIPFDNFSWRVLGESNYHPHYYAYQAISKQKGEPQQDEKFQVLSRVLPESTIINSTYPISFEIKNQGQSILNSDEYQLKINPNTGFKIKEYDLPSLEPEQKGKVNIVLLSPQNPGKYNLEVYLIRRNNKIVLDKGEVLLIPPPSLTVNMTLGFSSKNNHEKVSILVYNQNEKVVYEFPQKELKQGQVNFQKLYNVIPNQPYRVVGLAPYYLPVQKITQFKSGNNQVSLPRAWPLDFNQDGKLSFADLKASFKITPWQFWQKLI